MEPANADSLAFAHSPMRAPRLSARLNSRPQPVSPARSSGGRRGRPHASEGESSAAAATPPPAPSHDGPQPTTQLRQDVSSCWTDWRSELSAAEHDYAHHSDPSLVTDRYVTSPPQPSQASRSALPSSSSASLSGSSSSSSSQMASQSASHPGSSSSSSSSSASASASASASDAKGGKGDGDADAGEQLDAALVALGAGADDDDGEMDPPIGWLDDSPGVWRWIPGAHLSPAHLAKCLRHIFPQFQAHSVVELALENAGLAGNHAALLAEAIPRFSSLKHITLNRNRLTSRDASVLAKAVTKHGGLHSIDLEDNEVGSQGAGALAFCLQSCRYLSTMNLNGNDIKDAGLYALAMALSTPRVHARASGGRGGAGGTGGGKGEGGRGNGFAAMRSGGSGSGKATFQRFPLLQVADNGITSEGARFASSLCQTNHHVVAINLANNKIGDRGAFYLAEMFAAKTSVVDVNVECNEITNHGIRVLFNALQNNIGLDTLSCGGNGPLDFNSLNPGKWRRRAWGVSWGARART